jgi:hypothetical protein
VFCAERHAASHQSFPDGLRGDTIPYCERSNADPGSVLDDDISVRELDSIVSLVRDQVTFVGRRQFAGHVYNLETLHGYFSIAGGIFSGNTSFASNRGNYESYQDAKDEDGNRIVEGKVWLTSNDADVDEEICEPNGAQGPIPLDEDFDSGDDCPPGHPRCRCSLAPVVDLNEEAA